jgi:hypothetical protein
MTVEEKLERYRLKNASGRSVTPYSLVRCQFVNPMRNLGTDTSSWGLTYMTSKAAPSAADVVDLVTMLALSMKTIPTGATLAPSGYLSSALNETANGCWVQGTDISQHLDGSPAGSPTAFSYWTYPGISTSYAFPEGIAVNIRIQAPYGTDPEFGPVEPPPPGSDPGDPSANTRPRARDRGRMYFGPCNSNIMAFDATTGESKTSTQAQTDLLKWINTIATWTSAAGTIWDLGVWSQVAQSVKVATQAAIDERLDYQRRRSDQGTQPVWQTLA